MPFVRHLDTQIVAQNTTNTGISGQCTWRLVAEPTSQFWTCFSDMLRRHIFGNVDFSLLNRIWCNLVLLSKNLPVIAARKCFGGGHLYDFWSWSLQKSGLRETQKFERVAYVLKFKGSPKHACCCGQDVFCLATLVCIWDEQKVTLPVKWKVAQSLPFVKPCCLSHIRFLCREHSLTKPGGLQNNRFLKGTSFLCLLWVLGLFSRLSLPKISVK